MLSRALSLATVTLVVGCLTAVGVRAQENLDAGKTPAQIFSGTCNACHKSARGLLKTVPASSLSGFLRQHYTTSGNMANVLASFLISNGAADQRFQAKDQPKQKDGARDAKQEAATRPAAQQPDDRHRLPRPGEAPDVMRPDHGPAQAAIDAKQGAKQKQGKKGRPGDEPPKAEEPAKTEQPSDAPKTETAKGDDSARPESKSEPATAKPPRSMRRRKPSACRRQPGRIRFRRSRQPRRPPLQRRAPPPFPSHRSILDPRRRRYRLRSPLHPPLPRPRRCRLCLPPGHPCRPSRNRETAAALSGRQQRLTASRALL